MRRERVRPRNDEIAPGERLGRSEGSERVGMALGLVPVAIGDRDVDGAAPEPQMVVG